MEKFAFAKLVSFVTAKYGYTLCTDDIRTLHDIAAPQEIPVSADGVRYLLKAMGDGHKIEAIKQFRMITGAGLKESKDAVEFAMGYEP